MAFILLQPQTAGSKLRQLPPPPAHLPPPCSPLLPLSATSSLSGVPPSLAPPTDIWSWVGPPEGAAGNCRLQRKSLPRPHSPGGGPGISWARHKLQRPKEPGSSKIVHLSLALTKVRGWWLKDGVGSKAMGSQVPPGPSLGTLAPEPWGGCAASWPTVAAGVQPSAPYSQERSPGFPESAQAALTSDTDRAAWRWQTLAPHHSEGQE